ncbi:MAG: hypothetical protein NUV91_10440 [Candidatus Omnitrophica bacterium]|nr:hypothetical protein [Candidatus Omnitrophota bacterium]
MIFASVVLVTLSVIFIFVMGAAVSEEEWGPFFLFLFGTILTTSAGVVNFYNGIYPSVLLFILSFNGLLWMGAILDQYEKEWESFFALLVTVALTVTAGVINLL